eukprot:677073-Hanusia_phi.AAC.2
MRSRISSRAGAGSSAHLKLQLEVRNSKERLNAIVAKLVVPSPALLSERRRSGLAAVHRAGKASLRQVSRPTVYLWCTDKEVERAEDYRLQAEVEAASVETAKLHGGENVPTSNN